MNTNIVFGQNIQPSIPLYIFLITACAEANNKIKSWLYIGSILWSFQSFQDVIDHTILLIGLCAWLSLALLLFWISLIIMELEVLQTTGSNLENRQQYVLLGNSKSSLKPIKCGVPQGSILGPLLYLIYVNDIENSCDSNILSFADDTTIYSSHSDINSLFEMGNTEINNLYTRFCTNKLSLNAGKTKYIIIKPRQRHCDISGRNISINNVSLTRIGNNCSETSTKFLGILIDENLSWKQHILFKQ